MINRVVLVGRITRDPEVSQTNGGVSYVRFSVACDRPFKNQAGEKQADFISCVAWRSQADFIKNYVKKGNMLAIEGRLQVTAYQDQNGNNRQATDVLVESVANVEPKRNDGGYQPTDPYEAGFQRSNSQVVSNEEFEETPVSNKEYDVAEDDLPF